MSRTYNPKAAKKCSKRAMEEGLIKPALAPIFLHNNFYPDGFERKYSEGFNPDAPFLVERVTQVDHDMARCTVTRANYEAAGFGLDDVELTGELHQPLFGSSSFVCIEDGCRLVRRRFDCDSNSIVEESALDLGRSEGGAGPTHLVSCADALTLGIVHNDNLALLRFNNLGDLEVAHSTQIDGDIIGVVARKNDVIAAIYQKPTDFETWTGYGRESEIRLHSSCDGKVIGTLKLDGEFHAGDGTLGGLIAFSGNRKMLAYTVDDGVFPQVYVFTIPDLGSKSAPQEVWKGDYPDQARVDAMAFDASGGKLAISSTDTESILQVVTFDYNGQQQGERSIETNETTTIVFDQNGTLLVVQVGWNEIEEANDTTLLLRFTEPKTANNLSLDQITELPKIEPEQ